MKIYQAKLPEDLHAEFKRVCKTGYGRMTLAQGLELAAVLALVEAGSIENEEGAEALGVDTRTILVLRRLLDGKGWWGSGGDPTKA